MRPVVVLLTTVFLGAFMASGLAVADSVRPADGSVPPPGANDWQCAPAAGHPRPVVLLHGTWGNQHTWDVLAPELAGQGYCVYSLNYGRDTASIFGAEPGVYGTGDIRNSAREVGAFIDRVRSATHAGQVDVVAHSQGGVVARQYLRFEGGADPAAPDNNTVRNLITIAATNHGTTAEDLSYLLHTGSASGASDAAVTAVLGVAAAQQLVGSRFLRQLNAGGDTEPGIDYTIIASSVDEVTTPPELTFLRPGPYAAVHNIWVQSVCASDLTDHGRLPRSPTVIHIVEQALDPSTPGITCEA